MSNALCINFMYKSNDNQLVHFGSIEKNNASISKKSTCNFTSLQTLDSERHLFEEKNEKLINDKKEKTMLDSSVS